MKKDLEKIKNRFEKQFNKKDANKFLSLKRKEIDSIPTFGKRVKNNMLNVKELLNILIESNIYEERLVEMKKEIKNFLLKKELLYKKYREDLFLKINNFYKLPKKDKDEIEKFVFISFFSFKEKSDFLLSCIRNKVSSIDKLQFNIKTILSFLKGDNNDR